MVAMLLMNIDEEQTAFFALIHIMKTNRWRENYTDGMPKLKRIVGLLVSRLNTELPDILEHLFTFEV